VGWRGEEGGVDACFYTCVSVWLQCSCTCVRVCVCVRVVCVHITRKGKAIFCLSDSLTLYLFVYPSVCLSVTLSVFLSVALFVFVFTQQGICRNKRLTNVNVCMHTSIDTYTSIYTYIHTQTYTHTNIHTCICIQRARDLWNQKTTSLWSLLTHTHMHTHT